MKKSKKVILGSILFLAISSCADRTDQWQTGIQNGRVRDTSIGGTGYRYYYGRWYPIYHGMISPSTYSGGTAGEISSHGYSATHTPIRSGGFGSSAHASAGE